ncbi:AraC family carnitine catabolism transcriptional activator [Labrenzia sp. EL_208]|nr:AraC family carnitine catabolism transcriptional activator [Labrenzia sp. EL_132]MBG6227634.1 AraC family carnitine catabolism transcriptional activator [Labrenzia sp. EL_208]
MPWIWSSSTEVCNLEAFGAASNHIAFLLLNSFSSLDLSAALDALNEANSYDQTARFSWSLLSEHGNAVLASNGLPISVDGSISSVTKRGTVIILGGEDFIGASTQPVLAWLRSQSRKGSYVGAVGSAVFTLAKAGIVSNEPVTAHWRYRGAIAEHCPDLELKQNIFCIGEKILTCAGGAATLDLMLQLIAKNSDSSIANWVADRLVCGSYRTGQEEQTVAEFLHTGERNAKLASAIGFMRSNLEEPIPVQEIAASVGISVRQLERLFKALLSTSPIAFYRKLRLEHARRLLHQTSLPIIEISIASGFGSQSHFARLYRRHFGVSPHQDTAISLGNSSSNL